MKKPTFNKLERVIAAVAPGYAMKRMQARARIDAALSYGGAITSRVSAVRVASYSATGVRALQNGNLAAMRDRAIDLDHNNAMARAILDRSVDMAIGEGSQIQAKWAAWWQSPEVSGRFSGGEIERMAFRSKDRDGDIGTALLQSGKIALIPGGQIENKPGQSNTVDGVEIADDGSDRPVRYWVKVRTQTKGVGQWEYQAYEARDFILAFNCVDITELRGEPVFAQTFDLFDQLGGYIEAKVIASRMAACFGIIITSQNPASQLGALGTTANAQGVEKPVIDVEPGMVHHTRPGEGVSVVNGPQDASQFDLIVRTITRMIGAPVGVPAELALLDFSNMNLSSARAVMNQAYHRVKARRMAFHNQWLRRIYQWRISKWIKEGELPDVPDAWAHRIISRPLPLMDPKTEIEMHGLAIDLGLSNYSRAHMELYGEDFVDDFLPTATKEQDAIKSSGLTFEKSAGSRGLQNGGTSPVVKPASE